MTIPPFPSQDLAKLVLGYLAEEQLMTAYDEFLQASPYLDALRNEYDRIFMTSLKNILAEYRAVKIYVETCKPFLLRKKLVQCTNLLDVVKLLVSYTDVNKLLSQDVITDKVGLPMQNTFSRQSICEVCMSLNLPSCVCKSKQTKCSMQSVNVETTFEHSVETTALEDLPGNHVTTRKKHARVADKDIVLDSNLNLNDLSRQSTSTYNTSSNGLCNSQNSLNKSNESSSLILNSIVKAPETQECREKIEEFNSILNKVCNNKSNGDSRLFSMPESDTLGGRVNVSANFENFASGVTGHDNINIPVPDSSTSENSSAQTKDNTREISNTSDVSRNENELSGIQPSNNTYSYPRIKSKSNEQKIKILSDIKVDNPFTTLKNATSTPLMQTIVINGTPAYKQKLPVPNNNYTKDEIMAMPTIIVVPTSGPPQKLTQTQPVLSQKIKKVKTKTTSSSKLLGPLVIDVTSSPVAVNNKDGDTILPGPNTQTSGLETGLIKTVDVTKNASVPKDNTISGSAQTNTPQVVPPVRKSSSTPRRNTHIRVLDFTTPRRILHEAIQEKVPEESSDKSVEIVVTRSPNVIFPETANCENNIVNMSTVKVHKIETCHISNLNEKKDIKHVTHKKPNWDADLRALATAGEKLEVSVKKPSKSKLRAKSTKRKSEKTENPPEQKKEADDKTVTKKSRSKRKTSPKGKKSKIRKLEEEEAQYNESVKDEETKVALKPTFNIVSADLRNPQLESAKGVNNDIKSGNEEANDETPEAERLSLQNEMGAKLNISDLLETPYKQAMYDIQMETPKFLGSVLPDEPISDIKIMSIPTPRFFDTPKLVQATPSYSSRATDYSSGGSYYKPDEQDYLRIPDLECPVTSSKEEPNMEIQSKTKETEEKKISRPVRKCTKNVSYRARNSIKPRIADDKAEIASTCSDTSINSSLNNSKENLKTPKTSKETKSKLQTKSEIKKRLQSDKKRKTPIKKEKLNTFMKIKPRRLTPTKENKRARRKKDVMQNNSPKVQIKKKVSGKEKTVQISPVVTSAPTKSRRKSSTPRKLHCTKQFNSESSADSPEMNTADSKMSITEDQTSNTCQDSDTEHIALRWSDEGSQDGKSRVSECEDISKIKEYIETSTLTKTNYNEKGTLQVDLIKRGFDAETAKIIERDLLDTPSDIEQNCQTIIPIIETKQDELYLEKNTKNDTSVPNDLQTADDADENENDFELSVSECNEETDNYLTCHSDGNDTPKGNHVTLKDTWSMEVCIEDGVAIRLRPTTFNLMFDNDPENIKIGYSFKETEVAVSSISNIDSLYTPLKDRRSQCYEIFDSTLTSLDTPLKLNSPKERNLETTDIEIIVGEEKLEIKNKIDAKKRKRLQGSSSSEESLNDSKKTKPEAQYLFNSTNIQNIDIESVLKKLHGPQ